MFVERYLQELRRERFRPRATFLYMWRCLHLSVDAARSRPRAMAGVVLAGLVHLVLIFVLALLLSFRVDRSLAVEFFLTTGTWLLIGLAWVSLHLGMFRNDKELPATGLGLPNFLTLGRLLTIPGMYLFLVNGHEGLALGAFVVGGLSDVADGMAARYLNATTRLGRIFDPIVDVLFSMALALGLTRAEYLPEWLLAIILLRYGLLLLGGAYIYVFRGPVHIRPTVLGKTTGVVTAGLILAVILARRLLEPATSDQVLELLHIALAFVFTLTVLQVLVMGWYNIRHLRDNAQPEGALSILVGKDGTDA